MPRPAINIRILSGSSTQNTVTCGSALEARTGLRVAACHGPPAQHGDFGASAPLHFGDWVEPLPPFTSVIGSSRGMPRRHQMPNARRQQSATTLGTTTLQQNDVAVNATEPASDWHAPSQCGAVMVRPLDGGAPGFLSRPRGTWHNRSVCTWSDCQHEALNYMSFHMQMLGASFRLMPGMVWGMAVAASTRP